MIPDRIEHETLIEAPVETVWRVITQPDHISQWFSDTAELDPRPGGAGTLVFGDPSSPDAIVQPFFVESFEPTSLFSFRWCHEDSSDRQTKSLLVEFSLTPEGDNTRLRMVETGHQPRWNADMAQAQYDEHANGWSIILARLGDHAKAQS
jgi:uncharacterized protein YndB with AHSA1/START domain